MKEIATDKYAYTTLNGLCYVMLLTQQEIDDGIAAGIIEPVSFGGWHMYRYNPEEIGKLYVDAE